MARSNMTAQEKNRRKRFAMAVLLTCIAAAMIGGSLHVMKLGSMRMAEMRGKVSYDIAEVDDHVRAAGEDIRIQADHEARVDEKQFYSAESLQALLKPEIQKELHTMVLIPAGVFVMGSNALHSNQGDQPEHRVDVPDFWIDKYPVTQAQYAHFVVAKHYRAPLNWKNGKIPDGLEDHPVTLVSWYNARDYCAWAGQRLPYEAEWEKAARGTDARRWPWGNKMNVDHLNTYYSVGHTTSVMQYKQGASTYGVWDMAGNVSEWVFDVFSSYSASKGELVSFAPSGDQFTGVGQENVEDVVYRVMRGGSWKSDPFSTESYHRNYSLPNLASDFYGFRCASSQQPSEVVDAK
ncbi:MAG: formylglycine-generating enzyme family protein [Mariprofundaceae bacterium]|nr:formylglycine-generating enzyme family protein [Mariprofundaceae bacterium]